MRNNILKIDELKSIRHQLKKEGKKVVFTNGCYDIIHAGHVDYLNKSKKLGDIMIVGINSDISVRSIKGDKRPIIQEEERAYIISNLTCVDFVILFDEDTPENLINELTPDVLVKGADWAKEDIVGGAHVESHGGKIERIEFVTNQSSSKIIEIILERYKN